MNSPLSPLSRTTNHDPAGYSAIQSNDEFQTDASVVERVGFVVESTAKGAKRLVVGGRPNVGGGEQE